MSISPQFQTNLLGSNLLLQHDPSDPQSNYQKIFHKNYSTIGLQCITAKTYRIFSKYYVKTSSDLTSMFKFLNSKNLNNILV